MAADGFDPAKSPRRLVLMLGDQLDHQSSALADFDPRTDAIWMAEVDEEATHVWCHKKRIAFFFAAMRHFRDELADKGFTVHYTQLPPRPSDDRGKSFADLLAKDLRKLKPQSLYVVEPGDERVRKQLQKAAREADLPLEVCQDTHFLCSRESFEDWFDGRKRVLLEDFYRHMRKQHDILITQEGKPVGGDWNFDKDNRQTFKRTGPGKIKAPRRFTPDDTTQQVLNLVNRRFANHPGRLDDFDMPVTHDQARAYLRDFIKHRLNGFGTYEDAMWTDEDVLYHSRLSAVLNLKLISPRDCIDAAIQAYEDGDAAINDVEGFVRQILGWREFVRGVYNACMPDYADRNALRCSDRNVPSFFWNGETDMHCVSQAMRNVIQQGYAHHIQRLMVLGEFALLLGVHPYKFHQWHMAMYLDAIDWVSLPNALGMSQFGDGGIVGTKPYCATGNYINKMSNYCKGCRYNYKAATGEDACPFTTLYWDFLDRHKKQLGDNNRMAFQYKNLDRKSEDQLHAIRTHARKLKQRIDDGERI